MKIRLLSVLLLMTFVVSAEAQLCKNCFNYRCATDVTGYVNCMSNNTECRRWTTCTSSGGGEEDCGISTPCDGYAELAQEPEWQLARVEVCPAPKQEPEWRLASVEIVTRKR